MTTLADNKKAARARAKALGHNLGRFRDRKSWVDYEMVSDANCTNPGCTAYVLVWSFDTESCGGALRDACPLT